MAKNTHFKYGSEICFSQSVTVIALLFFHDVGLADYSLNICMHSSMYSELLCQR